MGKMSKTEALQLLGKSKTYLKALHERRASGEPLKNQSNLERIVMTAIVELELALGLVSMTLETL